MRLLAVAAVLLLAPLAARAEVERFAVLVGANAGWRTDVPLRYAEKDAARVHDVLRDLGGFRPENVIRIEGDDAETVRGALIAMNDRIRARDGQSMLLVYYSGHADAQALHLGPSSLAIPELQRLVRGSAATFRLLILDACRSGAVTRRKGGKPIAPFAIEVERPLRGEGVVFLTSSSADEDSQESDALGGSFFTHFLVSGLLGAADDDGDGHVTLDEVYRYAHENTLRETRRTAAGAQHPTYRYDLEGEGDLVLTTLATARGDRAALRFPPGRDYLVFAGSARGGVVAEITAADRARRLSVRAGRYFVRGRGGDHLLEGELALAAGDDHLVVDEELRRVEYARLVRKGAVLRSVSGPEAGVFLRSALISGRSPCLGVAGGWALDLRQVTLKTRAGVCRARFDNPRVAADTLEAHGELRLSHAWDLGPLSVDIGIAAGAALLHASFETAGEAPDRTTLALHTGAGPTLTWHLGGGFEALAEVAAQTFFFREEDASGDTGMRAHFAVQLGLGLGLRF